MKLYGPFGSVSHAGVTYLPGPDGSFELPREGLAQLLEHGFTHEPPARPTVEPQAADSSPPPAPQDAQEAPTAPAIDPPRPFKRGRR